LRRLKDKGVNWQEKRNKRRKTLQPAPYYTLRAGGEEEDARVECK
jgi:hypothetical protein